MPIVHIHLLGGRDAALVGECARQVAQTVQRTLQVPLDTVRVLVQEVPRSHWLIGDQTRAELDARQAVQAQDPGAGRA